MLLISGCTGGSETAIQTSNGIAILDFSALPKNVISGETVKLIYEIQNNGDYDTDIELYLQKIDTDLWNAVDTSKTISGLVKKQKEINGGKEIGFFEVTAPDIDKNTNEIHKAELKICYLYTTKTVFRYEVISSFEKQKEIEQGKYRKTLPFFQNSISPVLVYPLTKEPLYGETDEATVSFEVKNQKGGRIADLGSCEQDPSATAVNDFPFDIAVSDAAITILCDENTVRLIDNKIIFYCTLTGIKDKNSFTLTLTSDYAYYETKEASLVIQGI